MTDALLDHPALLHRTVTYAQQKYARLQEAEVKRMLAEWPLEGVEPALLYRASELVGLCRADVPVGQVAVPVVLARKITFTFKFDR